MWYFLSTYMLYMWVCLLVYSWFVVVVVEVVLHVAYGAICLCWCFSRVGGDCGAYLAADSDGWGSCVNRTGLAS